MSKQLILDYAYKWERERADKVWLTQPMGGVDNIKTFTWAEALGESRRMATYLKSLDLPEKSHIALFSKNTAWWIMADLAIWMAGHVTIPLYPTLTSNTVSYTLEHSDSKLIFVGKLDVWDEAKAGLPADLPIITTPLCPSGIEGKTWDELIAANEPMAGETTRDSDECATIVYTSGTSGLPKGAMLSFGAMMISTEGVSEVLTPDTNDRMLSYLPLSHVFERWVHRSRATGVHVPGGPAAGLDPTRRG